MGKTLIAYYSRRGENYVNGKKSILPITSKIEIRAQNYCFPFILSI